MSRYSATNSKGEKFEYGYDRPLQEYFIQKVILSEGFPECVELVGSLSKVYGSAANLLEAIQNHGVIVPEPHRMAIQFDLPF